MDENITEDGVLRRRVRVFVFGDTADEIEFAALDKARNVFGESVALEVVRDYEILDVRPDGPFANEANGKSWQASVTVRERA